MAELKTKKTTASVDEFLAAIPDESRRNDCLEVVRMMKRATKAEPKMWGAAIVGFGEYHYVYESGREGDMAGFEAYDRVMKRLGKHKTGKSCLYIKRLDDVDRDALQELIDESVRSVAKRYE